MIVAPIEVPGFEFSAVHAGMKEAGGLDLALAFCDRPAAVAGVFAKSQIESAPVMLSRERLERGSARAVVITNGVANVLTGRRGFADAHNTTRKVADLLGINEESVFMCGTGLVGVPLPRKAILSALPGLVSGLDSGSISDFAEALMPGNNLPNTIQLESTLAGKPIKVAGVVKGAGFLHPSLATMLSFVFTDAAVDRLYLKRIWSEVVEATFNAIAGNSDISPNDSAVIFASGARGNKMIRQGSDRGGRKIKSLLMKLCDKLARAILQEGEGATKLIEIRICGAANSHEAQLAARRLANSPQVKAAFAAEQPDWAGIICAIGSSGAHLVSDRLDVKIGNVYLISSGRITGKIALRRARKAMSRRNFMVSVHLHAGREQADVLTWS